MSEVAINALGRRVVDQEMFDKFVSENNGNQPVCGISGQPITVGDEVEGQQIDSEENAPYVRMVLVKYLGEAASESPVAAEGEANAGE